MCGLAKRCCFFISLRNGLIVWGYVYLFITVLLIANNSFNLHNLYNLRGYSLRLIHPVVSIISSLLDVIFTVTLVCGLHKNKGTLVKVYFYYSIIDVLVSSVYIGYTCGNWIYRLTRTPAKIHHDIIVMIVIQVVPSAVAILIQSYVIWMVKSLIVTMDNPKVRKQRTLKFVKNATEPSCTVTLENEE